MTKKRSSLAEQSRDLNYAWAEFLRAIASMFNDTAMKMDARAWAQEDEDYWLRGPDDERRP